MKKAVLVCCALALTVCAQAQWKPAGDKIKTKWAEQINPQNVLPEYPRPQLERTDWVNLNGEWEYAIKPKGEVEPNSFDGNILVPFAVESSLSGVQKEVMNCGISVHSLFLRTGRIKMWYLISVP